LLTVLVAGSVLAASSYPALSVLYSQGRLKPVLAVTAFAVLVMLPALAFAATRYGTLGAAWCWLVYGLVMYVAYQIIGLRGLPGTRVLAAIARDFVYPCVIALAIAAATAWIGGTTESRTQVMVALGAGLLAGWALTLFMCTDVMTHKRAPKWWPTSSR
jgi:hypothetical protein